ncbi:hypothetical protein ACTFIZ_012046 [Dictyostelium cf. discoideum]
MNNIKILFLVFLTISFVNSEYFKMGFCPKGYSNEIPQAYQFTIITKKIGNIFYSGQITGFGCSQDVYLGGKIYSSYYFNDGVYSTFNLFDQQFEGRMIFSSYNNKNLQSIDFISATFNQNVLASSFNLTFINGRYNNPPKIS